MKTTIFTLMAGAAVVCWLQCSAQKKAKKVAYEFPEAMAAPVRASFEKECDKGQILYNINCAKCHMTTIDGKQYIPDFTQSQLVGYELRVLNPKHESEIPETTVTAEELGQIMTFLAYKKRNPVPVK